MECRELAVLPAAHLKKARNIGLLLPPHLLDVLVRAHLGLSDGSGPMEGPHSLSNGPFLPFLIPATSGRVLLMLPSF